MPKRRLAMLVTLVLLLTLMPVLPAAAAPKAAFVPPPPPEWVSIDYSWERAGLILYGSVLSHGSSPTSGTVQLEKSTGPTWSVVASKPIGDAYGTYWFTPSDTTPGTYYRVRFLAKADAGEIVSPTMKLGYMHPLISERPTFSSPVAYDIRSRQNTVFYLHSGEPFGHFKLVVHGARSDGGDLVLFDKDADATHDFPGITWNGRDEKGQRLRNSGNYTWTLTASMPGRATETRTGGVLVCRILFEKAGYCTDGIAQTVTGYMVPGAAKVYLSKITGVVGGDTLSIRLKGPSGFSTASRSFPVTSTRTMSVTSYSGASAVRYRGVHTFSVTAARESGFNMTVIQ